MSIKKVNIILFVVMVNNVINEPSAIFHDKTKIIFQPDDTAEYFGYSVLISDIGLIVGAPKAKSRINKSMATGLVFTCRLDDLEKNNITCRPLILDNDDLFSSQAMKQFFKNDMWLGASLGMVPFGRMLICAPRWATPYKDMHLLTNGACYIRTMLRGVSLLPLRDMRHQAYLSNGKRKEYGEYGTHLNFYAYGQAGLSVKVTDTNTILIGAPGLLQWAGGVVEYRFLPGTSSIFNKQPIMNPYFTKDLEPNDYLGYSVESGTFDGNGTTLYVAGAPRAKLGYGQVFIFEPIIRESDPLKIQEKIQGPQLGSYFGASLTCIDIDGDGRSDLLVGAPTFVKKDGGLPYDQGAVFVYMAREKDTGFVLESSGYVSGSGVSGARFGTAIADLGDLDEDGFKDVAIGAPWENNGNGVVYIYRGNSQGLRNNYNQRIVAKNSKGFGISISKGFDVDRNNCSDLAIGAFSSSTAYLYRCIPTIEVHALIKVPDALDLPQNSTNFTALFCVNVPPKKYLSRHIKLDLKATVTVDPEAKRALISGDSDYTITAKRGTNICNEQIIEIKEKSDLAKPIPIRFDLEADEEMKDGSTTFITNAARLSEDSTMHSSFAIQLTRDCGEDLICRPLLELYMKPYSNPYVPGKSNILGVSVTVLNKEEPAYGAKLHLFLPFSPKRLPQSCTLQNLNMTCDIPAPLHRMETVTWEIELEYTLKGVKETELKIVGLLEDSFFVGNISDEMMKEVTIVVKPEANFSISGKALPNVTLPVTRENLNEAQNVSFVHYFEVTNYGPSDWSNLKAQLLIPDKMIASSPVLRDCEHDGQKLECMWSVPAKVSIPVVLTMRLDLKEHGNFLEEHSEFNVTTILILVDENKNATITSTLILEPKLPIWPLIVGLISGLVLLVAIVFGLYKYGFFSRQKHEDLKRLKEEDLLSNHDDEEPGTSGNGKSSPSSNADDSTQELIANDSE